ncbi:hypothetical protein CARUB_v10024505mg, partial [Capsella rubella]
LWSKFLKKPHAQICIKKLMDNIEDVKKWSIEDRIRFGETKKINHLYIKMVMDLRNVRNYPWGLKAYNYLLSCIMKKDIWVMEALPDIGSLFGEKLNTELTEGPRCSNWKGAAKISYEDIIFVESTYKSRVIVSPFISCSGNEHAEFVRPDEVEDVEVDYMIDMIRSGEDFRNHVWGSVEDDDIEDDKIENLQENDVECEDEVTDDVNGLPHMIDEANNVSGLMKRKRKQPDHGAETRKKQLLCHRAAAATYSIENAELKSFLKGLFDASISSIEARMRKLEDDISLVKDFISTSEPTSSARRSTPLQPSNITDHPCKIEEEMSLDDEFLNFGLGTQEFLQKSMGHLSQQSQVPGFDATQNFLRKEVLLQSNKNKNEDKLINNAGKTDEDAVLVFIPEAKWQAFMEWNMLHK